MSNRETTVAGVTLPGPAETPPGIRSPGETRLGPQAPPSPVSGSAGRAKAATPGNKREPVTGSHEPCQKTDDGRLVPQVHAPGATPASRLGIGCVKWALEKPLQGRHGLEAVDLLQRPALLIGEMDRLEGGLFGVHMPPRAGPPKA